MKLVILPGFTQATTHQERRDGTDKMNRSPLKSTIIGFWTGDDECRSGWMQFLSSKNPRKEITSIPRSQVPEVCKHGLRPFECGICNDSNSSLPIRRQKKRVNHHLEETGLWIPVEGTRKQFRLQRSKRKSRGRNYSIRRYASVTRADWLKDGFAVDAVSQALSVSDLRELKRVEYPFHAFVVTSEWQYMRSEEEADAAQAMKEALDKSRIESKGRGDYVQEKYVIRIMEKYLSLSPRSLRGEALIKVLTLQMKVEDVAKELAARTGRDPKKLRQNIEKQAAGVRQKIRRDFPGLHPQVDVDERHGRDERFQPFQHDKIIFKKITSEVWGQDD
jgi:hypothetical protein